MYDNIHKKAGKLNLHVLKHNADHVRRATEYRKWISVMHHVLNHSTYGKKIIDPETFEVD